MKRYLIIITFLLGVYNLKAQLKQEDINRIPILDQANLHLDPNHIWYNPSKGFSIYSMAASKGDPKAMNALGILYSEGNGTKQDQQLAVIWFEKAANAGYIAAWGNLGKCFLRGLGIKQNFKLAFEYFSKGSLGKDYSSLHNKGYMLYKGLAGIQNYKEAVSLFKQGAKGGVVASSYFLGLCFRNGYGVEVNLDSARYWLEKASRFGYQHATDELANAKPEFVRNANDKLSEVKPIIFSSVKPIVNTNSVTSNRESNAIPVEGEYQGTVVRYDWSGMNVISKTPLKLIIKRNGKQLSGSWKEGDQTEANIQGNLTDIGVIFSNTGYIRENHYSKKKRIRFKFEEANLNVVRLGDSVHLSGILKLWDQENNEPERPLYVSLTRAEVIEPGSVLNRSLVFYPNPFSEKFQVSITLESNSQVKLELIDMVGRIVYSESSLLAAGKHELSISPNIQAGSFVLRATYSGKVRTAVVIKY